MRPRGDRRLRRRTRRRQQGDAVGECSTVSRCAGDQGGGGQRGTAGERWRELAEMDLVRVRVERKRASVRRKKLEGAGAIKLNADAPRCVGVKGELAAVERDTRELSKGSVSFCRRRRATSHICAAAAAARSQNTSRLLRFWLEHRTRLPLAPALRATQSCARAHHTAPASLSRALSPHSKQGTLRAAQTTTRSAG